MKKQELISIEEQLYAKGIWKRPGIKEWKMGDIVFSLAFDGNKKLECDISGLLDKNMARIIGI